jgi:hypothetical protein
MLTPLILIPKDLAIALKKNEKKETAKPPRTRDSEVWHIRT